MSRTNEDQNKKSVPTINTLICNGDGQPLHRRENRPPSLSPRNIPQIEDKAILGQHLMTDFEVDKTDDGRPWESGSRTRPSAFPNQVFAQVNPSANNNRSSLDSLFSCGTCECSRLPWAEEDGWIVLACKGMQMSDKSAHDTIEECVSSKYPPASRREPPKRTHDARTYPRPDLLASAARTKAT